MKKYLILACTFTLAGCMTMNAENCKITDWYWLGQRDGYQAAPPYKGSMLDIYTAECAVHGTKPDVAAYEKGLESGQWNRVFWWGPSMRP